MLPFANLLLTSLQLKLTLVYLRGKHLTHWSPSLQLPRRIHPSCRNDRHWKPSPECVVLSAHRLYLDGFLQDDRSAACAVYSSTVRPPGEGGWAGRKLPNSSSSTCCELHGFLDTVTLLTERRLNGVVVCYSQSALHSLSSPRSACDRVVRNILSQLTTYVNLTLYLGCNLVMFDFNVKVTSQKR